ncbi:conserved hypothetical protein [Vibrio owensii]|uniref:Uncharacterized protein n=1 Tax=Vibrio owensii TaxID=696485 RepID=A0AAU9PWV0_9VIBR|nr:conserved hypothetical protein [Vibrio owensii]CAH1586308.1 conserved hypothetical protein [Vibrio owensii]
MLYIQQNLTLFTIDKNVCTKAAVNLSIPMHFYWKFLFSVSNRKQSFSNKNRKKE